MFFFSFHFHALYNHDVEHVIKFVLERFRNYFYLYPLLLFIHTKLNVLTLRHYMLQSCCLADFILLYFTQILYFCFYMKYCFSHCVLLEFMVSPKSYMKI
jgi:hypothetical protein